MIKILRKYFQGSSDKDLINTLLLASKEFPNDMEYGRCIRNFLWEASQAGEISENDMHNLMNVSISATRLKQVKP
mgnify:CR=1 FL=1